MDYHPWKVPFFVGHVFFRKRDSKPHFKIFTSYLPNEAKDVRFLVTEWQTFGPLESNAVLGVNVGFRKAYNTGIL
jgi:hypothetical protein